MSRAVPRPALAATRAIDILNFMAATPFRGYSLTELVRALGLNPASCHALLNAMARDGYLVRQKPGKTYRLGPALIAIGHGALQGHPEVAAARARMGAIAQEFDLDCMVAVMSGEHLIVLAVEGPNRETGPRMGQHVPVVPPIGTPFLAWAGPEAVEPWLARAGSDADRAVLRQALSAARERGYTVTLRSERQDAAGKAVAGLGEAPFEGERMARATELIARMGGDYLLIETQPDQLYQVGLISAPVFAPDGAVVCTLSLFGIERPLSARRLAALGQGIRLHAQAVTDSFAVAGEAGCTAQTGRGAVAP